MIDLNKAVLAANLVVKAFPFEPCKNLSNRAQPRLSVVSALLTFCLKYFNLRTQTGLSGNFHDSLRECFLTQHKIRPIVFRVT
ncbi:protein of unknown function [Methylocaldum szegediense]|uniref:Uncharacterized protein n=1 Tax=Methylocaldum szegediense TaxID=73780 RepID=A0ABN8X647_9GAMM|nr:protein of unknown function [Methylocaldum szegediense]